MIAPGSRPLTVKFILPALTEATSPYWRPIKYSLFPPLGLATLAAYLSPDDQAVIVDEHVEPLAIDDSPELVVIQVYITNAYRAYKIADHYRSKGAFVCLGGLHVTSLPEEATVHADTIFLGPGEQTFPQFLQHFRAGKPERVYISTSGRTLERIRPLRRDLIRRNYYLVQIPSSSRADVRSIVTSVTRTHSFRVGEGSTRSGWTLHWLKSSACLDGISISSTITCLATDVLRTRCLMA
jgi:radical SAM superfamily enzyme YgiQ (UPF0313 family)